MPESEKLTPLKHLKYVFFYCFKHVQFSSLVTSWSKNHLEKKFLCQKFIEFLLKNYFQNDFIHNTFFKISILEYSSLLTVPVPHPLPPKLILPQPVCQHFNIYSFFNSIFSFLNPPNKPHLFPLYCWQSELIIVVFLQQRNIPGEDKKESTNLSLCFL